MDVPVDYINKFLGLSLSSSETAQLLSKMQLRTQGSPDMSSVQLLVPPTRSDILHPCDVAEDVAIAYGYNNIKKTVSRQCPLCLARPCLVPYLTGGKAGRSVCTLHVTSCYAADNLSGLSWPSIDLVADVLMHPCCCTGSSYVYSWP